MKKIILFILMALSIFSEVKADELKFITEEYPPISFSKNGKVYGLAVDVVREINKRQNKKVDIEIWPWARGYNIALAGPNYVLFSMAKTDIRENLFKWVGPIFTMKSSFYVKRGSKTRINSLEDAKKLKAIGTYRNAFDEQLLQKNGFINLESTEDNVSNVRKLMSGRVEAITATNVTIPEIAKEAGFSMEDLEELLPFVEVDNYIAFSKQVPDKIVAQWQGILDDMKKDGTLKKIQDKWLK